MKGLIVNNITVLAIAVLLAGCTHLSTDNDQPISYRTEFGNIEQELANSLISRYVNSINDHDWNADARVTLTKCQKSDGCEYLITHWSNGCGFSSTVIQVCNGEECEYLISKYKAEICE